jgi:hypothetical protein
MRLENSGPFNFRPETSNQNENFLMRSEIAFQKGEIVSESYLLTLITKVRG